MPVNFLGFVLADTLVAKVQRDKGIQDDATRRQLALFAGLFSPKNGLGSAVLPAVIVQHVATLKADEFAKGLKNAGQLVEYLDASRAPRGQAKTALEQRGFQVNEVGTSNKFKSQTPPFQEGLFLRRGTQVTLEYENDT